MAARRLPKEVQQIFDKYMQSKTMRRLERDQAIKMLQEEFNLSADESNAMFDTFDKDHNGVLSLREFHVFYQTVGNSAHDVVGKFHELDKENTGELDMEVAREFMKKMESETGRVFKDEEIDFLLKTAAVGNSEGDDDKLDLGEFANLLFRLKMYKGNK